MSFSNNDSFKGAFRGRKNPSVPFSRCDLFSTGSKSTEILKAVSAAAGFSSWRLYGGFPEAERKVAGFFPDYVEPDGLDMFPIMPLTAHFREQDKLSHRDFLGSLMGLRISRELVGDILVGNGMAVFFVLEKAAPVLLDEFL